MNYREVGNTGVWVSEIGFGGGGNAGLMVRGTHEQQRESVVRALELGVNYFDQAPDYGGGVSESNLGRLLKELGVRPYVTTKVEVRADHLDDIAGHVTGLEGEAIVRPLYHGLGGVDLLGEARWRRLHINDDGVFHVDQVIETVAEHHLVAPARRPGRRRVGGRQRPWACAPG